MTEEISSLCEDCHELVRETDDLTFLVGFEISKYLVCFCLDCMQHVDHFVNCFPNLAFVHFNDRIIFPFFGALWTEELPSSLVVSHHNLPLVVHTVNTRGHLVLDLLHERFVLYQVAQISSRKDMLSTPKETRGSALDVNRKTPKEALFANGLEAALK